MLGYQSFAAGRALAAPFIVRLGAKRTLLLQLTVMAASCVAICATPHAMAPRVQAAAWALVRVFSAMTVTLMLPFVRTWVPRDAYGRVWGLLQSGVQTVRLMAPTVPLASCCGRHERRCGAGRSLPHNHEYHAWCNRPPLAWCN